MIKELFELRPYIYGRYDEISMLPVFKKNNVKYMIYGAGQGGKLLLSLIKRLYNIMPDFIVDKSPSVDKMDGVPVISVEEFRKQNFKKLLALVSIYKYHNDKKLQTEIDQLINDVGVENGANYIVYDAFNIIEPYNLSWYYYVKYNVELFEKTYNLLSDSISKETMLYYLRTIILGERYRGITFPEEYKYWGIDTACKKLFELSDDEILLNIGSARGDTIYQYLRCNNPFKKIIGVEASQKEYEKSRQNISLLEKYISTKIQLDHFLMGTDDKTIDHLYENEKISLICMDIEGAELSVLKSAVNTIRNRRPVLSICAYHKAEDLIDIPLWIKSNVEGYVFALRKYPSVWWNYQSQILQRIELVLYAIPQERYIKSEDDRD